MGAVTTAYSALLAEGSIEPDPAQAAAVARLDALAEALSQGPSAPRRSLFSFGRKSEPTLFKGLYIHGSVGRGKTMLMDLFYDNVSHPRKRRVHFHEFMADVHERIARARFAMNGDPIPTVAAALAKEAGVLCFDEFHVTDIADAMILSRLFRGLFDQRVVVIATSNASPQRLYWNGLNRQLFMPFVGLLETYCEVLELKSAKDFRLGKLTGRQLYFAPVTPEARAELDAHWERLTGHHASAPATLEVKGHKVMVPQASMGVARFGFQDLCGQPLGALDYLHLAHAFHTILIDGIPVLGKENRNEARRFITLIDTLYDNRICLIASAEADPPELYRRGDGADLFERTASRLMEMRSEAYLTATGSASPGLAAVRA